MSVWLYGFCAVAFFILMPPFIQLWLGDSFLIDNVSFTLIVLNVYLLGQSTIYNNARVAKGNFNKDKWIAFAQALVNLVVSIIAANFLGLMGVYVGTVVSRMVTIILRPIMTYRFLFEKSPWEYFKQFLINLIIIALACAITYIATYYILLEVTIFTFIMAMIVVVLVPNLIMLVCYFRTVEFKSLINRLKNLIKKKKVKNDE